MGKRSLSARRKNFERDQEAGREFEDFVKRAFMKKGINLPFYQSRRYQLEEGEGPVGVEVKFDRRCRGVDGRQGTGNYYIETSHAPDGDYVPSGIYRDADNAWLWAVGDFDDFTVVSKQLLQRFDRSTISDGVPTFKRISCNHIDDVPTKGFLVPANFLVGHASLRYLDGEFVKTDLSVPDFEAGSDVEDSMKCCICGSRKERTIMHKFTDGMRCPNCWFTEDQKHLTPEEEDELDAKERAAGLFQPDSGPYKVFYFTEER